MSPSGNEWWQEYDRRERKKVARQIIRWVDDPVNQPLPDDVDLWDKVEREAILTAWVAEMEERQPNDGDTLKLLTTTDGTLSQWGPTDVASVNEQNRRRRFLEKLKAAWRAHEDRQF